MKGTLYLVLLPLMASVLIGSDVHGKNLYQCNKNRGKNTIQSQPCFVKHPFTTSLWPKNEPLPAPVVGKGEKIDRVDTTIIRSSTDWIKVKFTYTDTHKNQDIHWNEGAVVAHCQANPDRGYWINGEYSGPGKTPLAVNTVSLKRHDHPLYLKIPKKQAELKGNRTIIFCSIQLQDQVYRSSTPLSLGPIEHQKDAPMASNQDAEIHKF